MKSLLNNQNLYLKSTINLLFKMSEICYKSEYNQNQNPLSFDVQVND